MIVLTKMAEAQVSIDELVNKLLQKTPEKVQLSEKELRKWRDEDEFYQANLKARTILPIIRETATSFRKYRTAVRREITRLDKLVNDPRRQSIASPGEDVATVDFIVSAPEDSDFSNTIGLVHRLRKGILEVYQRLLGSEDDESEVLSLLANPVTKSIKLSTAQAFYDSGEYIKTEPLERATIAQEELEALEDISGKYRAAMGRLGDLLSSGKDLSSELLEVISEHYGSISKEHLEGRQNIIKNPSLTSVAQMLYDKLPGISEVDEGIKVENIPKNKITLAAKALAHITDPTIYRYARDGNKSVALAIHEISKLQQILKQLEPLVLKYKRQYAETMEDRSYLGSPTGDKVESIDEIVDNIKDIDFETIKYQSPKEKPTQAEKRDRDRTDVVYEYIVKSLESLAKIHTPGNATERQKLARNERRLREAKKVVLEILRCRERDTKIQEGENTLFEVKTQDDEENMGSVSLRPMDIPERIPFSSILGSGYKELGAHLDGVIAKQSVTAVASIIQAKQGNRGHIMMLGPGGVGKTQVLRYLAALEDVVLISTTGAALGTAWMHKTAKNPGELFELGEKKYRETRKPVFIAIDEAETLLAKLQGVQHDAADQNKTVAEIQRILDGGRLYEGVTLIVALNNVDNLDGPMMRRYHTFIVGKLSPEERTQLFKRFVYHGFEVDAKITDEYINKLAKGMVDFSGDLIRAPVDLIENRFFGKMHGEHRKELEDIDYYIREEDGAFDLSKVTAEQRDYVKRKFAAHGYRITPEILSSAVKSVKDNGNVMALVKDSVRFYQRAENKLRQNPGLNALKL